MAAKPDRYKIAADNRRARFDYEIGETWWRPASMLTGTEVKSLRTGKATVAESYAVRRQRSGELML